MELMEFAPDAVMAGTPHLPGTREFFSCLEGQVTIFVAGERYELAAGDVLGFPGNVPHSYRNTGGGTKALGVSVVVLAKAGF
jgi:quercetin dioxygenase-like cupin family protein